jgi:hypothetical protein
MSIGAEEYATGQNAMNSLTLWMMDGSREAAANMIVVLRCRDQQISP